MKQQEEILVEFDEQGTPKIEVTGYTGPGCAGLTKNLELALGAVDSSVKKPEYHKRPEQQQVVKR